MNCCNIRILLPLEDYGLMGDNIILHCHTIVQLKVDWSGGWGSFLHVFPVLINSEVEFGLGDWMPL